jgi:hypothetical protein
MPHSPGSRFPNEIIVLLIGFIIDQETLSAISLVSRLFHRLAFPLAHHTVCFERATRVEDFISIVLSEKEEAPLRISQALRCLVFHNELNCVEELEQLDENLVEQFRAIIPKLSGLEHLTWNVSDYPKDPTLFTDFQHWCPSLRSIEMYAYHSGRGRQGELFVVISACAYYWIGLIQKTNMIKRLTVWTLGVG